MQNEFDLFINQYLVSNRQIKSRLRWNEFKIADFHFHTHPSLKFTHSENTNGSIIIIGDAFDYRNPVHLNQEVADCILSKNKDFKEILHSGYTHSLSGTYLIFYFSNAEKSLYVFGDTAVQRELFHIKNETGLVLLGSSENLLNEHITLKEHKEPSIKAFYNSNEFRKRKAFVTNTTNFESLYRLKPNHYLDISRYEVKRYFPNEKVQQQTLKAGAEKGAKMMKGYIEAISNRYPLMIPVSAGWDSRLFLAASREIKEDITYYVLQTQNKKKTHFDISTPAKLMADLNIPFEVIDYPKEIDNAQYRSISKSISLIREENFQYIINYFHKKHAGKATLNGNVSEVVRLEFDEIWNLNAEKITYTEKYYPHLFPLNEYSKWMDKNSGLFQKHGLRILDMLYWEENCANWVSKSKTEFRAAGTEVFSPFNSRELLMTLYGVKKRYRRKQNPVLYKKMIQLLWPETLQQPVNPGSKKILIRLTQKIGLFSLIRNTKLQVLMLRQSFKS